MKQGEMWLSPEQMIAGSLSADLPPGLFKPTSSRDPGALFWIIQFGEQKIAVLLSGVSFSRLFEAWTLEAGPGAWHGVHLGPVELLLEVNSAVSTEENIPQDGDLIFSGNMLALRAKPSGSFSSERYELPIIGMAVPPTVQAKAMFRKWALVRTDQNGLRTILYEKTA